MKLNPVQVKARALIKDPSSKFILLKGGTGGGKTFGALDCVIDRAIAAPGSRHACFRSTGVDAKSKLFEGTFRKVIEAKFPVSDGSSAWDYFRDKGALTTNPMVFRIEGSVITFGGLEENDLDRVLGADYATILIDEISLIERYKTIDTLRTRLRQKVKTRNGNDLRPKFIMACNPPSERHWTYQAFKLGLNPNTGAPHSKPSDWQWLQVDGHENAENLVDGYLDDLNDLDRISYQRFVVGDWYTDVENPMFHSADIAAARLPGRSVDDCHDLIRIEVAVDPAVSNHAGSDETGIIVVGRDGKNHGYVLADYSGKYQPHEWGEVAVKAYHDWKANTIVAEKNQGGNLVLSNLRTVDPNVPVKLIHASVGKEIRAEGASTAYKQQRIHHCGEFKKLEGQLLDFETGYDRKRKGSPDRLDALVHGLNSILLGEPTKVGSMKRKAIPGFWKES